MTDNISASKFNLSLIGILCVAHLAPAATAHAAPAGAHVGGATISCRSNVVYIEMRAFIPSSLCGQPDRPGNNSCAVAGTRPPPPGFPEPLPSGDRFHGDFRGFSNTFDVSHRLAEYVVVPDLHAGCKRPVTPAFANCSASHRCAVNRGAYFPQSDTAIPNVSANDARCTGPSSYYINYQANAGYPFILLGDNHIFEGMIVNSTLDTLRSSPTYGAQRYYIDYSHTPFPFHEIVVSCGGPQNVSVYRYSASNCGPGFDNLGSGHARDRTGRASFILRNGQLTVQ